MVGTRLRLLDPRDVLGARDDHVVGESLRADPAAVIADQRDVARPRRRASPSAEITFAEFPEVDSATSTSPATP